MAKRLPIRMWRVSRAEPFGLHVWFDPDTEFPRLYELEPQPKDGVQEYTRGDDLSCSGENLDQKKTLFHQEELPF